MTAKNRALIRLEIKEQLGGYLLNSAPQKVAHAGGLKDDTAGKSPAVTFKAGGSARPENTADGASSLTASIQVFLKVRLDVHDDPETTLDTLEQQVAHWVDGHRTGASYRHLEMYAMSDVLDMEAEDGTPWIWEIITLYAR